MQDYQQRLILFALLLGITCESVVINSFKAEFDYPLTDSHSTVYTHSVNLFANVTGCAALGCQCQVTDGETTNDPWPVKFTTGNNVGHVEISNLEAATTYSFSLTCEGVAESATLNITTDFDRPSSPENVTIQLDGKSVTVNWTPPSNKDTPISYYRITVDRGFRSENIPNSHTTYTMKNEYTSGNKYTFHVQACYVNLQKQAICSKGDVQEVQFLAPSTTATASTTTTTASTSSAVHSSVSIIILSLLLISKLHW